MDWEQSAPAVMGALVAGMCGICGTVVGALLTAALVFGQSWVNRRWHRQDVRAAEKRVRSEDRFEPVRTYAIGLQGFVHEAVAVLGTREWPIPVAGWASSTETLVKELNERKEDAEAVRPRPAPSYILRDQAAFDSLLRLQLEANVCHWKCLEYLDAGQPMSDETADEFLASADKTLDELLKRMDQLVEEPKR